MANQTGFAPIFPGWNVWQVWQVKDLPFSISMIGVSPERQLRIWVEDEVRLHSAADVADSIDLKGGQVQVIPGGDQGLATLMRKEQVPDGATFLVDGPANLFTVRFFNRGGQTAIAWPHDSSYLLDAVLGPDPNNSATSGPAPTKIAQTVGEGVIAPVTDVIKSVPWYLWLAGAIGLGFVLLPSGEVIRKVAKRKKQ